MTRIQVVKDMRAVLDRQNPDWRADLRRQMDAEKPGWAAALVNVMTEDGEVMQVALLANPESVPEAGEDDTAEPFAA